MHKAWREREENARDRLRSQYDEKLGETVERVRERTMTGPVKLTALIEATRYVVRHEIPGAIVECGVWRGGSMQAVALTLLALGETDRELHLFDTFEGMPPPTSEDTRPTESGSVSAEELLAAADKDSKMWAIADLHDVQEAMAETSYPGERVHFHPGLVEDTTPSAAPDTIAILRLDTDWYESTKHELEHLYERLSPGGVLILDDYGDWSGSRKATDEWLANTGEPLFLAPMASGRIAVKPALHPHVGARG
jgi:O-methyltransferase